MDQRLRSIWTEFSGQNAGYLQELYLRFRADPACVDPDTRALFERWGPPPAEPGVDGQVEAGIRPEQVAACAALVRAIRNHGHRAARLDPLGSDPPGDPELDPGYYGLAETELAALPAHVVGGPAAEGATNALEAVRALQAIYQGTAGYEFEHLSDADERSWLRMAAESGRFRPPADPLDEMALLRRLTEVGAFERFLHRAFPGQMRFSIEGLGVMVPMLDEIIGAAAEAGTRSVILGMAHRGRLNVLVHILGKPYEQIIGEFMGRYRRSNVSASGTSGEGWTGDVKYHLGARRAYRGGEEVEMVVSLAPNPSHLESVDPVVEGMARASGEHRGGPGSVKREEATSLPVLIQGDASFPGQGVVAETLNLSRLPGYETGGTIHLIANNQLGFTTDPQLARSTLHASDLAKGFEIPVVHVNADDPEACIAAARLAHAYREEFHKDVVINLVGYRRWGHNEGDEPSFTQPLMYARIGQHPTVRELWAARLMERGLVTQEEADGMLQATIERLHEIRRAVAEAGTDGQEEGETSGLEAGGPRGGLGSPGPARDIETALAPDRLIQLNQEMLSFPDEFNLHPKLTRVFERRQAALAPESTAERTIDWAHAETLALASILADGTPVRLTGQDTARGTFSQRHLVLRDVQTGSALVPLQSIRSARASFEVWDSPLSELACVGFEYGYSVAAPDVLVLWEAQYGDFINGAQVIVDEFLVSGRPKWEQRSGLVLLLPHGYEGQGPDHSGGRLERFLQLAAEDNLRIAYPSTAAQYFHVLRRQAKLMELDPRPLIVMTPKSLLRNPLAFSTPNDLAEGRFQPIIRDHAAEENAASVRRVVLCSGKIYTDLAATGRLAGGDDPVESVAVVRVEELYPFPAPDISEVLGRYPGLEEVVWLQEEPRNMGAWTYVAPRIRDLLGGRLPLSYIGRTRRASPAEGSYQWHVREQERIVRATFDVSGVRAKAPKPS